MTIMIEPRFAAHILSDRKIHAIRQNYPFWSKHDCKECSIRVWEGKPYPSRRVKYAAKP
jgi:hypothetical protein